jgi:ABC-type uncharacterized transport system substrate-binding protein
MKNINKFKLNFIQLIPVLSIFILLAFVVHKNISRKNILVVHSYSSDYTWCKDINSEIEKVLKKQEHIVFRTLYMDTKRNPSDEYKTRAGKMVDKIIDYYKPDVILTVDDDAQKFVSINHLNEKMAIVFTGVNNTPEAYGFDKADNVTGILERIPLDGLKDAFNLLFDKANNKTRRIAHISDMSKPNKFDDEYLNSYKNWAPLDLQKTRFAETFEEWKQFILEANKELDGVIIMNYRKLSRSSSDKSLVLPKEVMEWTMKNIKIPLIGTNGFVVEDGASLAIATSPYEQGRVGAELALAIANGKPPKCLPIQRTEEFIVAMRSKDIHQNILPEIYTAFSRATQKLF